MPTYLNKDNKPKRITARQLAGFFRAQKEWFSANDAYNKEHYGIDRVTYLWIREAVYNLAGICGDKPKLKDVNGWFSESLFLCDAEGLYRTYMNQTVRVS